ncbi:MAG: ATP-binding protein [Calothrix sp. C42_A2020_038]|nr:ATP-binding protein [Calothrix sp. C42_A2020_038]
MKQIFGYYIDKPLTNKQLTLKFSPSSISIKDYWRNNGLSADFIANYLITFLSKNSNDVSMIQKQSEIKSAASYIANELLENSIKYCNYNVQWPISVQLQFDAEQVRFFATNSINKNSIEAFQEFIEKLIVSDPEELYFKQLEKSAGNSEINISGLGLLSIINDYSAMLGWKFDTVKEKPEIITVTTMVQLCL